MVRTDPGTTCEYWEDGFREKVEFRFGSSDQMATNETHAGSHLCRLLPGKEVNPGFVSKSTVLSVTNSGEFNWSKQNHKHFVFPFLRTLYFVRLQCRQELYVGASILSQNPSGLTK